MSEPKPEPQPRSARRRRLAVAALVTGLLTAGLGGCAGAQAVPQPIDLTQVQLERGDRVSVGPAGVSMRVPKPFERRADRAFTLSQGGQIIALLSIEIHPLGDRDGDAALDARLEAIRRSGIAGIVVDEQVELGDLDGRLVEAIDLIGARRSGLLLVAVEAEPGLVIAQVVAPAEVIKHARAELVAALTSLRIAAPRR